MATIISSGNMSELRENIHKLNDKNSKRLPLLAFIEALKACPQVIEPNIGADEFVNELIKGADRIAEYTKLNQE
jgi:hypothetical protein